MPRSCRAPPAARTCRHRQCGSRAGYRSSRRSSTPACLTSRDRDGFFDHVLRDKWVLAVAGTDGKTTATSMLAWTLEHAGSNPGFLIGGVPLNFGIFGATDRKRRSSVIEADEYHTAFFDKRSKFVDYRRAPRS